MVYKMHAGCYLATQVSVPSPRGGVCPLYCMHSKIHLGKIASEEHTYARGRMSEELPGVQHSNIEVLQGCGFMRSLGFRLLGFRS